MDIRKDKIRADNYAISLNETLLNDGTKEIYLIDTIPSDFDIDDYILKKDEVYLLNLAISKLKPDEQKIIKYYYSEKKMTQVEIAKELNISQPTVKRKIKKIIDKLKNIMNDLEEL